MTHSTLTTKQQFWFDHVQAAIASEGSMAAYAAKHKLSAKALYAWKTRLSHKKLSAKPKRGSYLIATYNANLNIKHCLNDVRIVGLFSTLKERPLNKTRG